MRTWVVCPVHKVVITRVIGLFCSVIHLKYLLTKFLNSLMFRFSRSKSGILVSTEQNNPFNLASDLSRLNIIISFGLLSPKSAAQKS